MLNCTKFLTTQAQYDTESIGAFDPLIQHTLMNSLHCNSLSISYTDRVTKIPTVPLREKPLAEPSIIGKEILRRYQLKSDFRFCGNDSEVVSGAPVVKSRPGMITSQLNICTTTSQNMSAD